VLEPWMRWSLFSLIAAAVLALTLHATGSPATTGTTGPARLIPLTCPELVRLLRVLVLPPLNHSRGHFLHWNSWRRHHQAVARTCHQQRHHYHDRP